MNPDVLGGTVSPAARDLEQMLTAVRHAAAEILLDMPVVPRVLRVRAGDACVELEWPDQAAAGPATTDDGPALAVPAGAGPAVPAAPPVREPDGGYLVAMTVGVFYRAPQPGAPPFVEQGDQVAAGQQVAIIEAMKLMLPVEADRSGRITTFLVADGEAVEYGQPLFAIDVLDG
jgi:acetyl-CoA carboxylase biotin carboxyl carrier protein